MAFKYVNVLSMYLNDLSISFFAKGYTFVAS